MRRNGSCRGAGPEEAVVEVLVQMFGGLFVGTKGFGIGDGQG